MRKTTPPTFERPTRRGVLKAAAGVAGAAIGSGAISGFPTIWAQEIKNVTLRQFKR